MNGQKNRIASIDLLRAVVMLLMALDHVRDYFHDAAMTGDPMDAASSSPFLYFTRWITHFCAPVFVFLSGISAFLSGQKRSKGAQALYLFKRGVFLILIEFTVVSFGWTFDPFFSKLVMQVIWAIGFSMLALSMLQFLPLKMILLIALLIVFGHNLSDPYEIQGLKGVLWDVLHRGGFKMIPLLPGHSFLIVYPVLPWTGIMALGYAFGKLYETGFQPTLRRRILFGTAAGMILLFVLLRASGIYGDPGQWQVFEQPYRTLMSFMDVSKYPPSLLYTCMTLGPALLFLAAEASGTSSFSRVLAVFGRVPFFYYIVHIYIIHLLCAGLFFASGYGLDDIATQRSMFYFRPAEMGFSLPLVWLIWLALLGVLYVLCVRYLRFKKGKTHWIFTYI